ncbi:topoisomerase IV subunit A [Desulfocucumis palustris]|uniref:Topoisomerase IV subunit A n=1 Tax=Desulfocucumis palustris TaxID=1898651 RepID=A0A2L2XI15_9FIRM|nr:stalk domain-containing protein [Desulfocucumis palustris]GBF35624.1 topoisomerase IV subunit A [Desulfocucumis palustris]
MKKIALLLALCMVFIAGAAEATVGTKQLKASYENLKITVDGMPITYQPNQEPFIIDGSTFLSIRAVAEALGCTVTWVAPTKTVMVSNNFKQQALQKDQEIAKLKSQITQKDQEIQTLKTQVANLQDDDEDDDYYYDDDDDEDLSDLEDDLNDDYDKIGRVSVDSIELSGDEDDVDVEIEVDLGDDEDEWADLSDSQIRSFINSIVNDIQDEFSDDTEVSGKIIDSDSDDTLVKFSKEGDDSLEVDYRDEDYRGNSDSDSDGDDVCDDLIGNSYRVGNIDFNVSDAHYYSSSDHAVIALDAEDDDASDLWEELSSSTIRSGAEDVYDDIVEEFEDEDVDIEEITLSFYDEHTSLLDTFDFN